MTDVFTPEIEILREQFSDAAKRYPGLQCWIATWHTSCEEPVFCSSGKQAGPKDYFLPEGLLYTPQALIYRWNHSPCSAEELVDPLPDDYDEDDRELMLEEYEESVSWQKKTCLARRNSEHWETEKAIERLRVLAQKMSDFKILFHDACKVKPSDQIDLAYIEMQCEFEVYEYGETSRDVDGQLLWTGHLPIDNDRWSLIKWLWLLPVAARYQTVFRLSKDMVGGNEYRKALPIWRESHAPYVMKLDDVFLESALFCSRLLTVAKQAARKKPPKDRKKTADTKNSKTPADPSTSENSRQQAIQKVPIDLLSFMERYCIHEKSMDLQSKRGMLQRSKKIELPELARPAKKGRTHVYWAKELTRNWLGYCIEHPTLPMIDSKKCG
ncbi:MAG: hypothetical protein DRP56_00125 [Planctomycetota bacterium]|nr:MAG: hypothetical protein DRP56_00125 [Planctomycetota bacterium]